MAFSLCRDLWETDVKHLWDVLRLTNRQLVPADIRFRTMHLTSMLRHQSHSKLYSTVQAGDPPYQPLKVRHSSARAQPSHLLFLYP